MNVACFFVVMACFMLSLERVGGFKMKKVGQILLHFY